MSDRMVGRLSVYRRLLTGLRAESVQNVYSHQLARMAGCTAAQVRRDLMAVGYTGTPTRGYDVLGLTESIGRYLDPPEHQHVAIVGVGNLGRAILAFFANRRPKLSIVAAFDSDPAKVNRVIHGCRSYPIDQLAEVVAREKILVGIITVPAPEAQKVADLLANAGVRGILNFAPVAIHVRDRVYVEDMDITVSLERVAFFARQDKHSGKEMVK